MKRNWIILIALTLHMRRSTQLLSSYFMQSNVLISLCGIKIINIYSNHISSFLKKTILYDPIWIFIVNQNHSLLVDIISRKLNQNPWAKSSSFISHNSCSCDVHMHPFHSLFDKKLQKSSCLSRSTLSFTSMTGQICPLTLHHVSVVIGQRQVPYMLVDLRSSSS